MSDPILPTDLPRFRHLRRLSFSLLGMAFLLAFFHRVAPTVLAEQLATSLNASAVALGSIAAMYFHIYAVMQIPAGLIADKMGARLTVGLSAAIGGIGSILFALADDVLTASIGRLVIGFGVSFAFVGSLRLVTNWYRADQYAQVSGWLILIGNLGAIIAGTPLAFALEWIDWRTAFLIVGGFALLLSATILWLVRDSPAQAGFSIGEDENAAPAKGDMRAGLLSSIRMPSLWLSFVAGFALVGPFFGFAGIWAMPFLTYEGGLTAREAANCLTLALLLMAFAPALIGWYSDHVGKRKGIMVMCLLLSTLMWMAFWLLDGWGFWGACLLLTMGGACCCGMVLIYATAKDLAPSSVAGFAVALVNTGLFTGAALLQMLIGWLLSLNGFTPDGDVPANFFWAMGSLTGVSCIGLLATMLIPETHPASAVDMDEAHLDPI